MKSSIAIKDMGFDRAIDRLTALKRAVVEVHVPDKEQARVAGILEVWYGWKKHVDAEIDEATAAILEEAQAAIIEGRESYRVILSRVGSRLRDRWYHVIDGKTGIIGGPGTPPGLVDTGAFRAAVKIKLKGVPT